MNLVVFALNDLEEESGAILNELRKDLQQVAALVVINQNLQLLKLKNKRK